MARSSFLHNVAIFLWGLVWACAGGLGPAVMLIWTYKTTWSQWMIDWPAVELVALGGAAPLALKYYKDHKALLSIPEEIQAELDEARRKSGTMETTVQTTEVATRSSPKVVTTVKETHHVQPNPPEIQEKP